MPHTIERTDVDQARSADISAALRDDADATSTTIAGSPRRHGRRRRLAVLRGVTALAVIAVAAGIAIAAADRPERDRATLSTPWFVEAPPLAEPWVTAASDAAVPALVEAPPLAEPWVTAAS